MTSQTKIALTFSLLAVAMFGGAFAYQAISAPERADKSERQQLATRSDSHRLGTSMEGSETVVAFVDFDCDACANAYPVVEKLRKKYDGKVTFVARYFPNPSLTNSNSAAYAVESAARQQKFEDMYQKMFETQADWGDSQESKASLFRSYAEDLGLDMAEYDADVVSPEVAARVKKDADDGKKLGVTDTPSFFLSGQRIIPSSTGEFAQAIDDALEQ